MQVTNAPTVIEIATVITKVGSALEAGTSSSAPLLGSSYATSTGSVSGATSPTSLSSGITYGNIDDGTGNTTSVTNIGTTEASFASTTEEIVSSTTSDALSSSDTVGPFLLQVLSSSEQVNGTYIGIDTNDSVRPAIVGQSKQNAQPFILQGDSLLLGNNPRIPLSSVTSTMQEHCSFKPGHYQDANLRHLSPLWFAN